MRFFVVLLFGLALGIGVWLGMRGTVQVPVSVPDVLMSAIISPSATPIPTRPPLPAVKLISNDSHVFQTFNNCGPAALSMALSYYGVIVTQQELGQALRPYQVPGGDNDDKSVTLAEVATKARDYGLLAYHRPSGSPQVLKEFIALGYPVITRTWLKANEDIGHYRVVKGYDDTTGEFIQDDSLQGKNLRFAYAAFDELWKKFGYEYVVLAPPEKQYTIEQILGEEKDERVAWNHAVKEAEEMVSKNPGDVYAQFNLSVALYHTGDYRGAIAAYERVSSQLPFRTLWYQIEPILAYEAVGDYDTVFAITERVLGYHNRAFSELYLIRGRIYEKQGEPERAREQYTLAIKYNGMFREAQEALSALD